MGNKLCCDTSTAKQRSGELSKNSEQLIKEFMEKNQQICQVCTKPGQIYGTVDKNIWDYPTGTYIGRMSNRKRNGLGLMLFHDNMYYQGEWIDDKFQGRGRFIFTNGDFYDGEWSNCLPEGEGLYVSRQPKWRYEGHWEKGVQNGKGKEIFQDGSYYEGDFSNGLRHGKGKFRNHDGRFYQGTFLNGQVHGAAQACDFAFLYEGEWKNGKMDGTGKSQWYNQQKKLDVQYIGQYKDGIKNGFGEYRQKNGVVFKGNWQNGNVTNNGIVVQRSNNKSLTTVKND